VILGRASARPRRRGGSPGDGAGRGIWAGYRPGAGRLARSRAGVRDRIRPAQPWPGPAARPGPHRSHGRPGTGRPAGPVPVARPARHRSRGRPARPSAVTVRTAADRPPGPRLRWGRPPSVPVMPRCPAVIRRCPWTGFRTIYGPVGRADSWPKTARSPDAYVHDRAL